MKELLLLITIFMIFISCKLLGNEEGREENNALVYKHQFSDDIMIEMDGHVYVTSEVYHVLSCPCNSGY